jgi:hypothetical protein
MTHAPLAHEKYDGHWVQVLGRQCPPSPHVSVTAQAESLAHGAAQTCFPEPSMHPGGTVGSLRQTFPEPHCESSSQAFTCSQTQPTFSLGPTHASGTLPGEWAQSEVEWHPPPSAPSSAPLSAPPSEPVPAPSSVPPQASAEQAAMAAETSKKRRTDTEKPGRIRPSKATRMPVRSMRIYSVPGHQAPRPGCQTGRATLCRRTRSRPRASRSRPTAGPINTATGDA